GNVHVGAPLEVTFSEPLLSSPLGDAIVSVRAGDVPLSRDVQVGEDGLSLRITLLEGPAELPAQVTVSFSEALTDRAGNPLVAPLDPWQFTLPVWQWVGGPQPPSQRHQTGLAVDVQGRPVLAASTYPEGTEVLRWDGAAWAPLGTFPGSY